MTYTEFINKEVSAKNVLLQLGRLTNIDDIVWVVSDDNIWEGIYSWESDTLINYSYGSGSHGLLSYGNGGTDYLPAHERDTELNISSLFGGGLQLLKVFNYADLLANGNSFLWDNITQKISINTASGVSPKYEYTTLASGTVEAYSIIGGYYGSDIYYDSRIISAPTIKTSRDNQYYGKISFDSGSVKLDNTDGFFDDFNSENYYGAEVKILFGGEDLDIIDYETIYTGNVSDYTVSTDRLDIKFTDSRKILSKIIPTNKFNVDDYPDIKEDDVGAPISLGYGRIYKAKAYRISTSPIFKFVDTTYRNISAIVQVYLNNIPVSHINGSTTQGTFELTTYEDGDDVSVDFQGYLQDDGISLLMNPIDVMQDLLTTYTTLNYNSSYFDLANWEEARQDSTKAIAILIQENKEIIDVIEEISLSIFGSLVVNPNGKIQFNYRNTGVEEVKEIEFYEFMNNLKIDSGVDDYLNSVTINHSKAWALDTYRSETNNSSQAALFDIYRRDVEQEYDTVLTFNTDIEEFLEEALESFGGVFPIYKFTTKTQNIDLEVGDNIRLNAKLRQSSAGKWVKAEILSKSINLNKFTVTFEARFIDEDLLIIEADDGIDLELILDAGDGTNLELIINSNI